MRTKGSKMAVAFRKSVTGTRNCINYLLKRSFSAGFKSKQPQFTRKVLCGCAVGGIVSLYVVKNSLTSPIPTVYSASKNDDQRSSEKRAVLQTQRELRFLSFASVEHKGNIYMTPQDFLESVTEEAPRARAGRRHLSHDEVEKCFRATPGKRYGSALLFRNLDDKGLISYTEYLFLLCVLTKPKSGFKIAFNMFDTDGNQRVDKQEFLVVAQVFSASRVEPLSGLLDVYENKFGANTITAQTDRIGHHKVNNIWTSLRLRHAKYDDNDLPILDTTLTVHFFGRKGNETLKYEDFHRFMDDLQTEVLELEFGEFSHGMKTITEVEFAQILLRYTILTADEHEEYLERLRSKVTNIQGITFKEFKDFCQFLNNLDDFALAMKMYTYASHPISQDDFKRAVTACTGQKLGDHLVDVVYKLFDKDDDDHLSHKEFISVMKDRLHRGFRNYTLPQNNWDMFKSCVKNEMRLA